MALNSEQLAFTAEIVRESVAVVESAIAARPLSVSQESILADDIDVWESIRYSFVKVKGDGVDYDNERKRSAVFYRVRQLLGLPFVTYSLDAEILQLFELEVGQNFG
jgi:hypothetical protein